MVMVDPRHVEQIPFGAQSVCDLFDHQVRLRPAGTAVRTPRCSLTYAELDQLTARLARRLQRRGIGPGTIVGLHARRSLDALTGLVAVLRCGAAFLPLDVEDPSRRKQEVLADAGCSLTLVDAPAAWCADSEPISDPDRADDDAGGELPRPTPLELAYAITTSGSTGRPKVVGIPHAGIFNLVMASIEELDLIRPGDTILWTPMLTADISIHDCLMALCWGATVAIPDSSDLSIGRMAATAQTLGATIVDLPAAVLGPYSRLLVPPLAEAGVRLVLTGGSQLDGDGFADRESLVVANGYGPSEATVAVTWYRCTATTPTWVPIGRPFRGVRLYVLDEKMNQVPAGEQGQLHISGICLARGYLRLPGRTAAAFLPDPFASAPGERMYATGDLVRQGQEGEFVYLGRIDNQVKISGYRVELGEVEHAVRDCPGVFDASALLREDAPGGAAIAVFIVGDQIPDKAIEDRLRDRLPSHMVPRYYVWLDDIPLNHLGKVDRRALAAIPLAAP
jgi:amino acid adenylation domain-containing protein